jgi:hypothetical protein
MASIDRVGDVSERLKRIEAMVYLLTKGRMVPLGLNQEEWTLLAAYLHELAEDIGQRVNELPPEEPAGSASA